MGCGISKSVSQIASISPYDQLKECVLRFSTGALMANNTMITDPCSQHYAENLETDLANIQCMIEILDKSATGAEKILLFQEICKTFAHLRYYSLMRSDAMNHQNRSKPDAIQFTPICNEATFIAICKSLDPNALNTISQLSGDIIASRLAGKAEIVEANPGTMYDHMHGFLTKKNRNMLLVTSLQFFVPFETEYVERIRSKFLHCIGYGQQQKAEELLKINNQWLLESGEFIDSSGRTFNCTAYEYAYRAKDTHMCRMLEKYMNDDIRADMLVRINEHASDHFDFGPLKAALRCFIDEGRSWQSLGSPRGNQDGMRAAWKRVGIEQARAPAYVLYECYAVQLLDLVPPFNENELPQAAHHHGMSQDDGTELKLGHHFAYVKAVRTSPMKSKYEEAPPSLLCVSQDWKTIIKLDEEKTREIEQLYLNLNALSQTDKKSQFVKKA